MAERSFLTTYFPAGFCFPALGKIEKIVEDVVVVGVAAEAAVAAVVAETTMGGEGRISLRTLAGPSY